jgi:hypothetical protein
VSYNLLAAIGIASNMVGAAVAVEIGLVGLAGYALWSNRRRRSLAVGP